jgi:hypothetical protein
LDETQSDEAPQESKQPSSGHHIFKQPIDFYVYYYN